MQASRYLASVFAVLLSGALGVACRDGANAGHDGPAASFPGQGPSARGAGPGAPAPGQISAFPWTDGRCTRRGAAEITSAPMRPEDISVIQPMGAVVDAHVTPIDHLYVGPREQNGPPDRFDVLAPADADLVAVQVRRKFIGDRVPQGKENPTDYRMYFEISCTFWVYYDLVTRLAPDLAAQIGEIGQGTKLVRIPVRSGQVVGKIGGQTLDYGAVDATVTLPGFVFPAHYAREPWKIHTVDPFERMTASLRPVLLAKDARKTAPFGGKIDQDVDGKLAGNWFQSGTNGYAGASKERPWAGHLAFVHDYLDPAAIVVSMGTFGGRSQQFGVVGNAPDPASIGPESGIVRFVLAPLDHVVAATGGRWDRTHPPPGPIAGRTLDDRCAGVLLVQMVDGRRLRVEAFPGRSARDKVAFTSAALTYER